MDTHNKIALYEKLSDDELLVHYEKLRAELANRNLLKLADAMVSWPKGPFINGF